MVYYMIGNSNQAAELLSSCIKMNNFDFQSYVTLEEIYRESGNIKDLPAAASDASVLY